nr:E3 ubiquitin-protein ligase mib1-like [Cherax quadricarinatus]
MASRGASMDALSNVHLESRGVFHGGHCHDVHLESRGVFHGAEDCVKMLLNNAGVDLNSRNDQGQTPLHYAALINHTGIMELLLHDERCDHNAEDNDHNTAFHYAARAEGVEAAQCLLKFGLNPDVKNVLGQTPLECARLQGRHIVLWWLRKLQRTNVPAETSTTNIMVSLLEKILKIFWCKSVALVLDLLLSVTVNFRRIQE